MLSFYTTSCATQAQVRTPKHTAQQLHLAPEQERKPTSTHAPKEQECKKESKEPTLLKMPPLRAQARRDCMVCMEPVARGSIAYYQRGCNAFMCQGCAVMMCSSRADSSGQDGCSNGEIMCSTCRPHHPIAPATLACTITVPVFKKLQVRFEVLCFQKTRFLYISMWHTSILLGHPILRPLRSFPSFLFSCCGWREFFFPLPVKSTP